MKKSLILFCAILATFAGVYAGSSKTIYTTEDGTKLKCTATKTSGSIEEFNKPIVDYYEFKNGKIYSRNMILMFAGQEYRRKQAAKKVSRLKISDDEIKFKDTFFSSSWSNYKWATINRNNGNYYFKAKRENTWGDFYKKAEAKGKCTIVK